MKHFFNILSKVTRALSLETDVFSQEGMRMCFVTSYMKAVLQAFLWRFPQEKLILQI